MDAKIDINEPLMDETIETGIAEKVQDVLNRGSVNLRLVDVVDGVYTYGEYFDNGEGLVTLCFCDDRRNDDVYTDAFGDDWNDTPYEHNAGIVSDRFEDVEVIVRPHTDISVTYPHEGHCNSDWCRDDMKTGVVPLAVTVPDDVAERYGDDWRVENGGGYGNSYECIVGMRGSNRIYFGDMLFPVLGAIRKCADIVDVIIVNDGWKDIASKHQEDIDDVTDEAFKPKRFEIEEL